MKFSIFSLLLFTLITLPVVGEANTVVRTGDQYELPTNQAIVGNFTAVSDTVVQSGQVEGDSSLFGNQVTLIGKTNGDVLAAGLMATIDGIVTGDVRVVAGRTIVSGSIAGDVHVFGGSLDVLSSANIGGDILLYTSLANVAGTIAGNVLGSSDFLTVNGSVDGGLDVHTEQLHLGKQAIIGGDVRYTSHILLSKSIDTIVTGEEVRIKPTSTKESSILLLLFGALLLGLVSLACYRYYGHTINQIIRRATYGTVRSFLYGLVTAIILPSLLVLVSLCVYSVITLLTQSTGTVGAAIQTSVTALLIAWNLSILSLTGLVLLALLPALLGWIALRYTPYQSTNVNSLTILAGVIIVSILSLSWLLLPVLGVVCIGLGMIITLGAIINFVLSR